MANVSCISVQCPPGKASRMTLSPCLSTVLFPIFSPTLSLQTLDGRHRYVAAASANTWELSSVPGPGLARRKADVSLSLSFYVYIPLLPCSLCSLRALFKALNLQSCLSLTISPLVLPSSLPWPTPSASPCTASGISGSSKY